MKRGRPQWTVVAGLAIIALGLGLDLADDGGIYGAVLLCATLSIMVLGALNPQHASGGLTRFAMRFSPVPFMLLGGVLFVLSMLDNPSWLFHLRWPAAACALLVSWMVQTNPPSSVPLPHESPWMRDAKEREERKRRNARGG